MGTMYYGDAEQEDNFSFGCNDDEDDDDDDDESYIEIAIEPTSFTDEYEDTIEFQFRISFSSVTSFPPMHSNQCSSLTNNNLLPYKIPETQYSSSSSSLSASSSASNLISSSSTTPSMYSEWDGASQKPNPPVPSYVQKTLVSGFKELWEIGDTKGCLYENLRPATPSSNSNWNLIQSRKTSKAVEAINVGIMKFFIKFRSVKLQSILSFVKKSQKVIVQQGNNGKNRAETEQQQNHKKWRVAAINLDAIKGVIEAVGGVSIGRRKDRNPKRKSCPNSIKSSPIHQGSVLNEESKIYTRDNSIQAAISHCKRSFGVTPDSCA